MVYLNQCGAKLSAANWCCHAQAYETEVPPYEMKDGLGEDLCCLGENVIFKIMQVQTTKGYFMIREALPSDLPALVDIHVTSFNAIYPSYQPKPGYQFRERQWKKAFVERPDNWFCFVAQQVDGPVVGFATGHDFYDPVLPYQGQLDKIHLLKSCQRLGLGTWLVLQVAEHFLQNNKSAMILFADPANPSIRFYDGMKGKRLCNAQQQFAGAYGWTNLKDLVNLLRKRLNIPSKR